MPHSSYDEGRKNLFAKKQVIVVRSNTGLINRGHGVNEMTRGDRRLGVYGYWEVPASGALNCTELTCLTGTLLQSTMPSGQVLHH